MIRSYFVIRFIKKSIFGLKLLHCFNTMQLYIFEISIDELLINKASTFMHKVRFADLK